MARKNTNALKFRQKHKPKCGCRYCRVKRYSDPAEASSR